MKALFIDTGALVARVLPRDQHHVASRKGWEILENIEARLYSSEHVLDEAVSLLIRHGGAQFAARSWVPGGVARESSRAAMGNG